MRDRLLEDSVQEFNCGKTVNKVVPTKGSFKVHCDKMSGVLLVAEKYSNRAPDHLVQSVEFNTQIDKYLSDMNVPNARRSEVKQSLIDQLKDTYS